MGKLILFLLILCNKIAHQFALTACCQTERPTSTLCTSNSTCIIKSLESGTLNNHGDCSIRQDSKYENKNRSEEMKAICMRGNWDVKSRFDEEDSLPFYLEMFKVERSDMTYIGFDVQMHYIEFVSARFRFLNLHHCKSPYGDISERCNPRCVRLSKNDKLDNQAFLTHTCEEGLTEDLDGVLLQATGDTYLFSMCMTDNDNEQRCGEYWFLVPSEDSVLDTSRPDHQVLVLVDKVEYDQNSEVIIIIPSSHVLKHEADMLSVQLLHDSGVLDEDDDPFRGESCWYNRTTAAVIHIQNITFNKYPGQNIRVRITKYLPSGKYQVAMIPFRKDENGTLVAMAPPSCTPRLERLNLGKHALAIILVLLGVVIFSGVFFTMYNRFKEDENFVKSASIHRKSTVTKFNPLVHASSREVTNVVIVADFDISELHNNVMDLFVKYLRTYAAVDKIVYAPDPKDGINYMINLQTWWGEALRDPKTIKDGFVIFMAGPTRPKVPPRRSKYPNLINFQMMELDERIETPVNGEPIVPLQKLTLNTVINQGRLAIVKFPYSDLSTVPPEVPQKVLFNSVISIPQEMKELIRQIQRAEQLTVAVNLQKNLAETEIGRELLEAINRIPKHRKLQVARIPSMEKKWKAVVKKSVSFLSTKKEDQVESLIVPLATDEDLDDQEMEEMYL